MTNSINRPTCLVFAGHDPGGGAGLQADIETLASMGCHAATLVTCLTVQDTSNVYSVDAVPASTLIEQARTLMADMSVQAIKIGLIPDEEIAEAIHTILVEYPDIPVVLDPILQAGGGHDLLDNQTSDVLRSLLFPLTTVLTPNGPEARHFANNADTLDACGIALLDSGCEFVLLSGGHEESDQVVNKLYGNNRCLEKFSWPRLPHEYHGSGCTLASGIAGLLAHGHEPHSAVREAQQYTWEALKHAYQTGKGQLHPNRFYWTNKAR